MIHVLLLISIYQTINWDLAALATNNSWTALKGHLDLSHAMNWDLMELRRWPPTTHGLLFSISIYHTIELGPDGAAACWRLTTHGLLFSISDLSSNQLGPDGAAALATNNSWTALQHLDLSHNQLGSDGAVASGDKQRSWTTLQHLNLSDNELGPDGAAALATNKSWTALQHLDLLYNELGPDGAAASGRPTTHGLLFSISIY